MLFVLLLHFGLKKTIGNRSKSKTKRKSVIKTRILGGRRNLDKSEVEHIKLSIYNDILYESYLLNGSPIGMNISDKSKLKTMVDDYFDELIENQPIENEKLNIINEENYSIFANTKKRKAELGGKKFMKKKTKKYKRKK